MITSTEDIELKLLVEAIYLRYRSDFRDYSIASLRRRVPLAMQSLGCDTMARLQERILHEPEAYSRLLQYITVPTSEMFRDPGYYRALREGMLPILRTYPSIKIWIAGCSTGEELYSMAIMLKEEGLLARTVIYATDINPESLRKAEAGIFAADSIPQYTAQYQKSGGQAAFSDYYRAAYGSVIFDQSLRATTVFSDHSLATDSVFAEVQFVSCRNVLIYFNRGLQERAFNLFKGSLSHRGFLGLGSKETIRFSTIAGAFDEFDPQHRVYRKRGRE